MCTPYIDSLFSYFCSPVGNFDLFPFPKWFTSPLLLWIAFCISILPSYWPSKIFDSAVKQHNNFSNTNGWLYVFCPVEHNEYASAIASMTRNQLLKSCPGWQWTSRPRLGFHPLSSQHHGILHSNMPSVDGWQNNPHHYHCPAQQL